MKKEIQTLLMMLLYFFQFNERNQLKTVMKPTINQYFDSDIVLTMDHSLEQNSLFFWFRLSLKVDNEEIDIWEVLAFMDQEDRMEISVKLVAKLIGTNIYFGLQSTDTDPNKNLLQSEPTMQNNNNFKDYQNFQINQNSWYFYGFSFKFDSSMYHFYQGKRINLTLQRDLVDIILKAVSDKCIVYYDEIQMSNKRVSNLDQFQELSERIFGIFRFDYLSANKELMLNLLRNDFLIIQNEYPVLRNEDDIGRNTYNSTVYFPNLFYSLKQFKYIISVQIFIEYEKESRKEYIRNSVLYGIQQKLHPEFNHRITIDWDKESYEEIQGKIQSSFSSSQKSKYFKEDIYTYFVQVIQDQRNSPIIKLKFLEDSINLTFNFDNEFFLSYFDQHYINLNNYDTFDPTFPLKIKIVEIIIHRGQLLNFKDDETIGIIDQISTTCDQKNNFYPRLFPSGKVLLKNCYLKNYRPCEFVKGCLKCENNFKCTLCDEGFYLVEINSQFTCRRCFLPGVNVSQQCYIFSELSSEQTLSSLLDPMLTTLIFIKTDFNYIREFLQGNVDHLNALINYYKSQRKFIQIFYRQFDIKKSLNSLTEFSKCSSKIYNEQGDCLEECEEFTIQIQSWCRKLPPNTASCDEYKQCTCSNSEEICTSQQIVEISDFTTEIFIYSLINESSNINNCDIDYQNNCLICDKDSRSNNGQCLEIQSTNYIYQCNEIQDGKCKTCNSGFQKNEGYCYQCINDCTNCNSPNHCINCSGIFSYLKILDFEVQCKQFELIDNCIDYVLLGDEESCDQCEIQYLKLDENYILNSDFPNKHCIHESKYILGCGIYNLVQQCTECTNSNYLIERQKNECLLIENCQQVDSFNCIQCKNDYLCLGSDNYQVVETQCNHCLLKSKEVFNCSNYIQDNFEICQNCDQGTVKFDSQNICIPEEKQVNDCTEYNYLYDCISCQNSEVRFIKDGKSLSIICDHITSNCEIQKQGQTICVKCKTGYILINNNCLQIQEHQCDQICYLCPVGIDCANQSQCYPCLQNDDLKNNCIGYKYTDQYSCSVCGQGYLVFNNFCIEEIISNCLSYQEQFPYRCLVCEIDFVRIQEDSIICSNSITPIQNCDIYSINSKCILCKFNFITVNSQSICISNDNFVQNCYLFQNNLCTLCLSQFHLVQTETNFLCIEQVIQFCELYNREFDCTLCQNSKLLQIDYDGTFCSDIIDNCEFVGRLNTCLRCKMNYLYNSQSNNCILFSFIFDNCIELNPETKNCSRCNEDHFLIVEQCIESCLQIENCYQCDSDNKQKCNLCLEGYVEEQNECIPICLKDSNCEQCMVDNPSYCEKCSEEFVIFENACVNKCSDFILKDPSCNFDLCLESVHNCQKCNEDNYKDCIECNDGYVLQQQKCFKKINQPKKCQQDSCIQCTQIQICQECDFGYSLENSICVQHQTIIQNKEQKQQKKSFAKCDEVTVCFKDGQKINQHCQFCKSFCLIEISSTKTENLIFS